jgi:hypothetical protein
MNEFPNALKQGMDAAEKAEIARKEIDAVFIDLEKQILDATDGKLKIFRTKFSEEVWQPFEMKMLDPKPPKTYQAIAAKNFVIKNSPVAELAKWSPHYRGYPCKLTWSDKQINCMNKKALEEALADLIRDPLIADQLATLLRLEPDEPQEESA